MMSFPGLGDVLPDSEDDLLEPEVEDEGLHNLSFFFFSVIILYVVQLLSSVWLSAAHQASLSFTISLSLLKLMSTELVMP